MITRFAFFFAVIFSGLTHSAIAGQNPAKRAFSIEDSIKMVRIVDPDVALSAYYPPKIKISPDGKYFTVVTRSGNIVTGNNDFNLLLYRTDDVRTFLNEEDSRKLILPPRRILISVSTSRNEMPFQKLTWLGNSKTIAFIGWFDTKSSQSPGQIFKINIHSGRMQRLTAHKRPITDFALNIVSKKIIFASSVSRHNKDHKKTSYLMGVIPVNGILDPNWEDPYPAFRYYLQEIDHPEQAQPIGGKYYGSFLKKIWLSPNGEHAVVLTTEKNTPERWLEGYDYLKNDFFQSALKAFDKNTMIPRADLTNQFSLINLSEKTLRSVFDAPTGLYVGGSTVEAYWLPDSESVILANTALPLNVPDEKDRQKRRQIFSTVEYHLENNTITPILNHVVKRIWRSASDKAEEDYALSGLFHGLEMDSSGLLNIRQVNDLRDNLPDKYFRKKDGEWIQIAKPLAPETTGHSQQIEFTIVQNLNNPPEIMAKDISSGHKKIITDFNPQFRKLTFGKVKAINWKDREGRLWRGGLVYPPNYKAGQKYPLVIQTHGFDPREFLIDGPYGTASAFAAQALANKDIFVLQMNMPSVPPNQEALYISQIGFESAIRHLGLEGLIDKRKVGLIGWSATGVDVQQMLLYSDYPIVAATIADSYNIGLFGYINQFGRPAPGMSYIESKLGGGVPWGKGLNKWVVNNPTLHLDRLKTPLRYEQYETGLSSWLGTYALLKRQKKPVEYYVFNDATHALIKPEHRMTSQQGTVDWFTFWLKGEEGPDPAKADQYKRWHKLSIQQEKSEISAMKARCLDNTQKANSLIRRK